MDASYASELVSRRTIATFGRYHDAQSLVIRLCDNGFPVDRFVIGVTVGGLVRLFTDSLSDSGGDLTSTVEMQTARYEVMADDEVADEVLRLLGVDTPQQAQSAW